MSFMRPWISRFTRWPLVALFAVALAAPASAAFAQDDEQADEDVEDQAVEEEVGEGEIADTDASAVVVFRDRLSPYGSWVETPGYGLVWVPASRVVGPDFSPYVSAGHWELTEEGDWLWVSDYEWGAIPFHYGRWVWAGDMGWAWVPGRVYSPAWVTWRVGADGYIGWAPLPAWYYWVGGVAYYHHHHFHAAYSFCHTDHVFHHHVHKQVFRDKADVAKAAKSTRPYTAANPTKGGSDGNGGGSARKAASPSLDDAGVKSANAPKSRSKGDPRALEFAKADSIKKSKEQSSKMKSAGNDKPRSNAIGFAAPSVETQRAKHEAARAKNPRTVPAKQTTGDGRKGSENRTFDGAAESRTSKGSDVNRRSNGSSRSQGRFEGGSAESRRNDGPSPRSETRSTRPSKGSAGVERRSRSDSPSTSPSRGSSGAQRTTRSKRTNSGSSSPSTRSSAPSTRSHVEAPSRSSAPSTSSSPSRPVPKSSPSRGTSRGGRRGR